jgi:alpha-tubulin suppressor-like RCC1 family protein
VVDLPQEFGGILVHQWRRVVGRIRLKPVWSALAIVATIASGVIAPCFISTDAAQAVTPSEFSSAPTPTITGDLSVGSTLTVNPGAWNPSPSFTYQWVRDGLPIKNGTSSTYTLVPADYAKSVSVRVVGSKPGFIQILRMSLSSARVSAGAYSPTIGSDFAGQISAGGYHSCAVQLSGQVQCVGENFDGQLGNGWLTNSSIPVTVSGITTAVSVTAGGRHSCAVLVDGTVECWGSDFWGQLGNGLTARFVPTPVRVSGITTAVSVTAGTGHSCAVLVGGAVKCWGHNSGGQLGNGSTIDSSTPVTVSGITTAVSVTAGVYHSCAVLVDGAVKCWGSNFSSLLGNGSTIDSSTPVSVSGITTAVSVTAGSFHSCAVLVDGTVKCWGSNFDVQLGNGWLPNSSIPVTVSGITTAVSVTAGGYHSCAVLVGGAVKCWGFNDNGQVGNGSTARFVSTPVRVSGITTAVSVTAGGRHSCEVLVDGSVKCWGSNYFGQFGDGSNTNSSTPVWSTGFGSSQVLTPTPSFSGTAAVGSTLTAVPGTWDAGVSFSYQWKRAGVVIPSATGSTYVIQNDDAGKTLTVVVTGSKAGFVSVSKTSASTSSVLLAGLVPTFSTPVKTATGFTVNVTNYNAAFTFTPIISVGSGTVTAGTASGTTLPLTVSGVTAGATTVTVATTRLNYATGTGTIASAAKPVISSLTSGGSAAATVLRGASVTITGSNFSGATSVTIGGVAAPKFTVTSPTTIVVGVWATAITGVVRVETPGGTAVSTGSLTISSTLRAPTLAVSGALSASTGGRGTAVTVTGTNLGSVTQVMRGTVAVPFVVLSETQIVLAVPSGLATGTLVFTTAGGSVTSGTFTASPSAVVPTVTSTGLSGKVGTVLTIAGTNLGAVTGVSIGGLAVTNWWVKDAGRLSILVPPTAGLGAVNVVVTTAGGAVTTPATITG